MPDLNVSASGTYKDETGSKQEFSVEVETYSDSKKGFDLLVEEYGTSRIVTLVNKARETAKINGERTKLTSFREEVKSNKASAFDELMSADTPEQKAAIAKKYGLA